MTSETNIAGVERWASAIGGAALAAYGLRQLREDRGVAGALIAAAATGLIYRGAVANRPPSAAGINTAGDAGDTRSALGGPRGVHAEEAVTIARRPAELYDVWRDFSSLPRFMDHLVSVQPLGNGRSRWVARAPAGRTVAWDAAIIKDVPGELISWRTLPGSRVVSAGSVWFRETQDRGTEVKVHLQYAPPAGKAGATVAWLLGHEPSQTIREDLRRFKQLIEAGEVPTTKGQPRGRKR
jgi:uncharacterized membrane protein